MNEPETQRLARLYLRKLAALEALKKSLLHQSLRWRTCMSDKPVDNPKKITLCDVDGDVSAFEKFKEILVAKLIPYKFNSYI